MRNRAGEIPAERQLKGHTDGVTSLSFFPDNVRAASGSNDRTIKIWDVTDGRLLRTLEGHGAAVKAVSVSADGKWVASGSADHTVRVWDTKNGDQIAQLEGHTGIVQGVAFLPDGRLLSGAGDGLRLWEVANEKLVWKSGPTGLGVFRLVVSADGRRAAYVARDGSSYVWGIPGQSLLIKVGGARRYHRDIGINWDGSEVYGTDPATGFTRWDVQTGNVLAKPPGMVAVFEMRFFPDRQRMLLPAIMPEVWEVGAIKPTYKLRTDFMEIGNCTAISPNGKLVLYGAGGFEDGENWIPGKLNLISVFSVPDAATPILSGPRAGKMSWEVVAARVNGIDGKEIPFSEWKAPDEQEMPRRMQQRDNPVAGPVIPNWSEKDALKARGLTTGLDALWTRHAVLLHDGKGSLREILRSPGAGYWDAVWDGAHVWVGSARDGILVLDRTGKLLTTIASPQGLPVTDASILLFPLSQGRILATGAQAGTTSNIMPGGGWCGIVEWNGSSAPSVNVFFRETQLPDDWDTANQSRRGKREPI